WKNSQRQWDRNFFAQGQFRKEIGRKAELMVNAKYARDHMRYLNPDTTLMLIDNSFMQQELYLSATGRYSLFSWWDIAAAADWQYNTLDSDMTMFVYPRRHQLLASIATP
ncbi:MAG: TonB-dependent receptor, partial [Muribaculaceae bacterium]|nr:TonB-dependent receptor [Muribaculaceae bacterium]